MKKKLLALLLCAVLVAGLVPAAAAGPVYFPEFSQSMGEAMKPDKAWPAIGSSTVPTQSYFGQTDDWESCKKLARDYIDLLVETGNFTVVNPFKVVYGKEGSEDVHYSADLRYTGSAPMNGTLKLMRANGTWPDYGEYHITVRAARNAASYIQAARRNHVEVRWDSALRPEGIDFYAGEDPGTTTPDTGTTTPGTGTTTPGANTGSSVGSAEKPREDLTVVLGLGYNKMCVGRQVTLVDEEDETVTPVLENGRTLVPVSRIVAALGGKSTWEQSTRTAGFELDNRSASVTAGSPDVLLRRGSQLQKVTMDTAMKIYSGRTYVPLRYVLEGLGLWVGYEPKYRLVVVSTENLDGENLIKLPESQRLFASEPVPDTPRKTAEHYTIDGFNYTMEVGEALTLFNSRSAISGYSGYTWDVLEGGELVQVDRKEATCRFYAKRPGVVKIQANLDEMIVNYFGGSTQNTYTCTMTITITAATNQGSSGGLMHWQTCPSCNGAGTIRVGTRQETCPTCLGKKQVLM